jgi:hypothetical protein
MEKQRQHAPQTVFRELDARTQSVAAAWKKLLPSRSREWREWRKPKPQPEPEPEPEYDATPMERRRVIAVPSPPVGGSSE